MGLFDRFRRKPNEAEEQDKSFFLEPDKASSLGDVIRAYTAPDVMDE